MTLTGIQSPLNNLKHVGTLPVPRDIPGIGTDRYRPTLGGFRPTRKPTTLPEEYPNALITKVVKWKVKLV